MVCSEVEGTSINKASSSRNCDALAVQDRSQPSIGFLQSAANFSIHDGSIASIGRDSFTARRDVHVTINHHYHLSPNSTSNPSNLSNDNQEPEPSNISSVQTQRGTLSQDTFTRNPLPVQRSCDIYRRDLEAKGRGIPLWIPEPDKILPIQYQRDGIAIGDVGIVTPSGGFIFLFNVCNPSTMPPDLKPVARDVIQKFKIAMQREFREHSYLSSVSSVRRRDGDSTGLVFESSEQDGAILTMPVGARSEDLTNIVLFRKYVTANLSSWYRYAYHDQGYEVRNGDIRVATGTDKTSAWGMATFSKSGRQESATVVPGDKPKFHLEFGPIENGNGALDKKPKRYGWEYSGVAEVRAGPDAREIAELRGDDTDDDEDVVYENQCLFIRTLNATLPNRLWEQLGIDRNQAAFQRSTRTGNPGRPRPDYSSSISLADHPSNAINQFLLKNCSEDTAIAVTSDKDWISVLREDDRVLPSSKELLERIMKGYDICEEDGIVFLNTKCQNLDGKSHESSNIAIPNSENNISEVSSKATLGGRDVSLVNPKIGASKTLYPTLTSATVSCEVSCIFCRAPEDLRAVKLINECDLSDGQPCAACRDHMAIEAKISAAKRVLDDLVAERWKIRSRMNRSHNLVGHVPTEIMRSIFQFCLPTDDLNVFDDDNRDTKTFGREDRRIIAGPLLLGRICKTWRNIAWKTEPLWTVMRIFLDRTENPNYIDLVKEWLDRAGQLPLSLRISKPHAYTVPTNDAVIQLLEIINGRSKQWKTLDIFCSRWIISQFKGESGEGAPDLQSLRIKYSSQFNFDYDDTFSLRGAKPRPSRLVLDRCDFRLVHFEWDNLTSACLSYPLLDAGIELLRLTPGIISYRLYEITRVEKWLPKPDKPTIYPALESLELDCDTDPMTTSSQSKEIIIFFENFVFPNLTHLKVKSGGFDNKLSWAPVIANLEKSSPPLKSLSIQYLGPQPFTRCILPIMQISPLLQDLEILTPFQGGADGREKEAVEYMKFFDLFDSPLYNSSHWKFLPNLQSLSLSVHRFLSKDTDRFWSHICDIFGPVRWYGPRPQPLQMLQVRLNSWYSYEIGSEDIALQVLELQKEGTAINVVDENGENVFKRVIGPCALQVGEPLSFDAASSWNE